MSANKEELMKEIAHQLKMGEGGLAEEDKFLLECNFNELATMNGEQQEYWILATGSKGGATSPPPGGGSGTAE